MRTGRREWKRRAMERLGDKCTECGVTMILWEPKRHETTPPNACTIQHHISRLNPDRGKDYQKSTRLVCNKCNGELNDKELAQYPKGWHWVRSGRRPIQPDAVGW